MIPRLKSSLVLAWTAVVSCSSDPAEPRRIPAHTVLRQGIAHAQPLAAPERYCSLCHGPGLAGGRTLQPSCYQCHGQNWERPRMPSDVSAAPATHTIANSRDGRSFMHAPELFTPEANCAVSGCHGVLLEGSEARPACELCHGRLWEARGQDAR